MTEIYVSTDVETDGPIPGPHSMLSFASAAYTADKRLVSTFTANLETLPGASAHPKTAAWWATEPEAYAACRTNLESPEAAMARYVAWLATLDGKPVFVAYPAGFDFLFVYWYLMRFVGESPFSHSALDMKTFAMALMQTEYRKATKQNMPKRWFDPLPHTHVALDDAIEQGALFCNMLAEARDLVRIGPDPVPVDKSDPEVAAAQVDLNRAMTQLKLLEKHRPRCAFCGLTTYVTGALACANAVCICHRCAVACADATEDAALKDESGPAA